MSFAKSRSDTATAGVDVRYRVPTCGLMMKPWEYLIPDTWCRGAVAGPLDWLLGSVCASYEFSTG